MLSSLATLLLTLSSSLAADSPTSSFGGADLGVAAELDAGDPEILLDLSLVPLQRVDGRREDTWARMHVGWNFLEPSLDGAELSVFELRKGIERGQVEAAVFLGKMEWNQDLQILEVVPAHGGLDVQVGGEGTHLFIGAELDYRRRAESEAERGDFKHWTDELWLGVPLALLLRSPSTRPLFTESETRVRPRIRLMGDEPFAVDLEERLAGGYRLVQGDELNLQTVLAYGFLLDTSALGSPAMTHQILLSVRADF